MKLLAVHLKNWQTVFFNNDATNEQVANSLDKDSNLTAFFKYCAAHPEEKILYKDFPNFKTWHEKEWKERKAYFNTLGRMNTVSPADGELFDLRMLLDNMESPHSFESLYEFEGGKDDSYAKACLGRGLIKRNDEYIKTMEEACHSKQPSRIRNLFALLLMHCNPLALEELLDMFKEKMFEDLKLRYEIKVDKDA